jgi:PAS domain S-box-containing protein
MRNSKRIITFLLFFGCIASLNFVLPQKSNQLTGFENITCDSITVSLIKKDIIGCSDCPLDSLLGNLNAVIQCLENKTAAVELADSYVLKAILLQRINNFKEAELLYSKSIQLVSETNDVKRIIEFETQKGKLLFSRADFPGSMSAFLNSLKKSEEIDDKSLTAMANFNIATVYLEQQDADNAILFFNKAINRFVEVNSVENTMLCYSGLGASERLKKNYWKALEYYKTAVKNPNSLHFEKSLSLIYNNIGTLYKKVQKTDSAFIYFNKALELKLKIGDETGAIHSYLNIARLYKETGLFSKSFDNLNVAYSKAKNSNNLLLQRDVFKELSDIYRIKGNFEQAFEYLSTVYVINDSIFNSEKIKISQELEKNYSLAKTENELIMQKKELEHKELIISQQNSKIIMSLGALSSAVLVLLILVFAYRLKNKSNKKLQESKKIIESQNMELEAVNNQLMMVNKELEKLSLVASETDNSIMIFSTDGEFEWANAGFERLTGYTFQEYRQMFGSNLFVLSSNAEVKDVVEQCFATKKPVSYSSSVNHKSGQKKWTHTTLTPILDSSHRISKIVAIDADITVLKDYEEAVRNQKSEIEMSNKELERKNAQLTNSIKYAKHIQVAILPSEKLMTEYFREQFVIYMPRDIVSGDFYWVSKHNQYVFIALVDCTGHGVPGAFMSMIGNTLLNQIVNEKKIFDAGLILKNLHQGTIFALSQGHENTNDDGMEIALCAIDTSLKRIQISATNQSVFLCKNGCITETKYDLLTIGTSLLNETEYSFQSEWFDYDENTNIYMATDGLFDQFGGPKKQKFSKKQFLEILCAFENESLAEQKDILLARFCDWKNNGKQIDDTSVIAFKPL